MKHALAIIAAFCLMLGCMHQGLAALEHEIDHAPPPPLEYLFERCEQGEETACEAYFDLRHAQETEEKQ